MISRELFKEIVALIQKQDEIDEKVSKALGTVGDGYYLYGTGNKCREALFQVLESEFDKHQYISWWLYENAGYKVWETINGKEIEYDLESLDALYDFIVHNNEESKNA